MTRARLIRSLLLAAAALSAVSFLAITGALLVTAKSSGDLYGAFWWDAWLGFSVVGGVLVYRRPEEPLGRLLTLIGFFALVTIAGSAYANYDYGNDHRVGPLGVASSVLFYPAFAAAFACTSATVLTFPSGRLTTRLHRVGGRVIQVATALVVLGYLLRARLQIAEGKWVDNPMHPHFLGGIPVAAVEVGIVGLMASAILAIVSAVRTFRRSQGDERQQMRWFARSSVVLPALFLVGILVGSVNEQVSNGLVWFALLAGLNAIAVAIGIAVSRFGLYDIDRVISRTVSYLAVTGVVAGGYVGVVALTQTVIGFSSSVAVAASTLIAAAAFQPLRRRIQRTIDRRFDRAAYDARRTVDAFAARLRDQVDVEAVRADLLATVSSSLAPVVVSVWSVP